ncbi:AAA family ATPase, partial [Halomonas sp. Ps84H-12]|uniref:AAA family ATPase n=1 Tax=Halomonas sp. Ps84H-12 TaxID=2954501 RepID=UPI0020970D3B
MPSAHRRKLPIGIQTFSDIREGNYYYVDKAPFIEKRVIGRVDRTIARSGPPQIRACAIDALGSSTVRFTRRTLGARF